MFVMPNFKFRKMNPKFLRIQWADQVTSDPKKTSDFYSKLLGFGQMPVDEPNDVVSYCLTNDDGEEVFGVVDKVNFRDWASGWVLYFEVEDFEAQCTEVEALGGTVIHKGKSHCLINDPSGAPIVISPSKETSK